MTGSSHRNYDLDVRARQSNSLDDGDDNLNRAIITQETTGSSIGGHHGYSGHSARDNATEVYQDIDSGSNEQRNKLYVSDPEARDDLTLDLGQSNVMDDDDRNTNYANIEQTVAARAGFGHHGGGHGSSGDNWADVDQTIDSGSNWQKNYASIDDARAGDDLMLTLRQSNSMDDGDRNGNFSEVAQDFASGSGGSTAHSYGGHDGRSGDNDADVDQTIDSGSNRQKNYADLDDLRSRGDLDVDVAQGNTMHDDDLNTNGSSVEQRGGNNWTDIDQSIDSGSNHQSNKVDFDPSGGSYGAMRGGNDYGHGGGGHGSGGDIEVDLVQRNWMDDGDDNMNDAGVVQVGGRGADNDATVWQNINSGSNSQSNHADFDVGGRGAAGAYDVEQVNWMADDDVNTNQANIEQRSVDNWADVDQHIDSGSNTQHNSLDLDFG